MGREKTEFAALPAMDPSARGNLRGIGFRVTGDRRAGRI